MSNSPLELMVRKLCTRATLDAADRNAILALPHLQRTYHPSSYVVQEGEPPRLYCDFIQDGFACRQKLTADGSKQIVYAPAW